MRIHHPLDILTVHGMLGESLCGLLSSLDRYQVRLHGSIETCRRAIAKDQTSLLLVDVRYEAVGLLDFLAEVKNSPTHLMLLGIDPSEGLEPKFLELEADASLPLDTSIDDLAGAVDQVLDGEKIYPPSVAFMLYQRLAEKAVERNVRQRLAALALTPRELEILNLLAEHCSNETIGSRLGISIHTVKNHVHNILDKLKVENRTSAAELAFEQGWIEPASPAMRRSAAAKY